MYNSDFLSNLDELRQTGRSWRIATNIIQDFFNKPIGTAIPIVDHYTGSYSSINLVNTVKKILLDFFPATKYEMINHNNIVRLTPTYQELRKTNRDTEQPLKLPTGYVDSKWWWL